MYQAVFRTGPKTDDSFMTSLEFEVHEQSAQLYVQVMEYSGREDLFVTVYAGHEGGHVQVARSTLGKYANALGPAVTYALRCGNNGFNMNLRDLKPTVNAVRYSTFKLKANKVPLRDGRLKTSRPL